LDKDLIKITGRKEIPGRPFIYETTQRFLEYFGLRSLADLPERKNFEKQMKWQDTEVSSEAN
jgi:segregation and condensation protein B